MTSIERILTLCEAYGRAAGVEPSTVSWRVFGDGKKLDSLRKGGDLTTRRLEQSIAWFDTNWPEGHDWPAKVERPSQIQGAA